MEGQQRSSVRALSAKQDLCHFICV
jgi:hypothetical protein